MSRRLRAAPTEFSPCGLAFADRRQPTRALRAPASLSARGADEHGMAWALAAATATWRGRSARSTPTGSRCSGSGTPALPTRRTPRLDRIRTRARTHTHARAHARAQTHARTHSVPSGTQTCPSPSSCTERTTPRRGNRPFPCALRCRREGQSVVVVACACTAVHGTAQLCTARHGTLLWWFSWSVYLRYVVSFLLRKVPELMLCLQGARAAHANSEQRARTAPRS